MQIENSKKGESEVVALIGRLDANSAPELDRNVNELVDSGSRSIILELSRLEYMASAGLRSILSLGRTLNALHGKLMLCGASGIVKDVLVMSGFSGMFPLFDSIDQIKE